jgi:DNA-binding transcriptional ArsR family regulator
MPPIASPMKRLLWWLIAGTRGGESRARIILSIHDTPKNANQLSESIGMEYKTVRHHLDVLQKNSVVSAVGDGYGTTYFLSNEMEANYAVFGEIWDKIGKKKNTRTGEDKP